MDYAADTVKQQYTGYERDAESGTHAAMRQRGDFASGAAVMQKLFNKGTRDAE